MTTLTDQLRDLVIDSTDGDAGSDASWSTVERLANQLDKEIQAGAAMLTRQCDLAHDAETRLAAAEKERDEITQHVCDECAPRYDGWNHNCVEGRIVCMCIEESEPYQLLLTRATTAEKERDRYQDVLVACHGGEPVALLSELDAATERAEVWHRQMRKSDAAQHRLQNQLAFAEKTWDAARERIETLEGALRELLENIDDLMSNSGGVYGLHLNGDPSPWTEITEDGYYSEWLDLSSARAALTNSPTHTDLMISPEEIEAMDMPDTTPEEER